MDLVRTLLAGISLPLGGLSRHGVCRIFRQSMPLTLPGCIPGIVHSAGIIASGPARP